MNNLGPQTAFGRPRNALNNRFVYATISQRAHGLSIGINMNPDKQCNFKCVYCEVDRDTPGTDRKIDLAVMAGELQNLLRLSCQNRLREIEWFRHLPDELLELKEVALSGNGEPTLCVNFDEVVREVLYVRSNGEFPFFKIVLITNGTGLDFAEVKRGIRMLSQEDDIWIKLDAGSQQYMDIVNRPEVPLWRVLGNIATLGRTRPVIIQSLFPLLNGQGPCDQEIDLFVARLNELRAAGARIKLVQIYSAHRPAQQVNCGHLPLKQLSLIAQRVREQTGLKASVF